MPPMEWAEKLSTRIPRVDRQHQVILKYIDDLYDGIDNGEARRIPDLTLDGLVSYTRTYFAYEEMLFKGDGE